MVVREEIPDKEKAFHYFVEAVNHSLITGPQLLRYDETIGEDKWDEQLAREIIQSNARAIEYVKQGALQSRSLAPLGQTYQDELPFESNRRKNLWNVLVVCVMLMDHY